MSDLHVICKLDDAEYAICADEVEQMESFSGAVPVPGAPSYVAGLVQIRQKIIPVLDLRQRFGMPPAETELDSRVIVVSLNERVVGLLVDSARRVERIAAKQCQPPPQVVAARSAGFVRAVARVKDPVVKDRLVMLLDTAKVIGEETNDGRK